MRRLPVLAVFALLCAGLTLPSAAPTALADAGSTGTSSPSTSGSAGTTTPSVSAIISTATRYLGYPYASIGDDPSTGFSCIGFVHFVFAQNGVYVPEDLGPAYASAPHVQQADLRPGDLVFFKDTFWQGISHVALYVGDGKMIAADSLSTGVEWDQLSDAYWQEHYLGATRPLSNPTGTPIDPAATPLPSGPSLAPPAPPSLAIKSGTVVLPLHAASLYSGPGYSYTVIDSAAPGHGLTVVQTHGQWIDVTYDGGSQFGWIHGPDISGRSGSSGATPARAHVAPAATATPAATSVAAVSSRNDAGRSLSVAGSGVSMYSGPASSYYFIDSVAGGATVTVLRTQNGWDQVVLPDGTQGWVSAAALH